MHMLRGSSALSDGIASTMSSSSASRIFAICCALTKGITMRRGLTCPYAKTRHSHAPSRRAVISVSRPFWADCTINIGGFEFSTGTAVCDRPSSSSSTARQGMPRLSTRAESRRPKSAEAGNRGRWFCRRRGIRGAALGLERLWRWVYRKVWVGVPVGTSGRHVAREDL
jgi:hypothetical protein